MFDRLPSWGKRASWAHQNSFEAFGLHAPAALLALIAVLQIGELQGLAIPAALVQPMLRLIYLPAYVANVPPLRGLCWAGALLCTGILYIEGVRALLVA
ncbi:MAPEG family protein [Synechococcus sp. BIOS-U3-1]|nr:MAPEG family protein [Synechococcus sp. BIOS-U3-1]